MTLHVVQMSGGIGSWAAAQRVAAEHGTGKMVLLFADTLVEDHDLYRFNADACAQLGMDLTVVCDGRTPFEVFHDQGFLGNSLIAPCSYWLKQKPCRDWLKAHADPRDTVVYIGIDWSEDRRVAGIERGWAPWTTRFPMCEPPYLTKDDMLNQARAAGIEPPRLYALGYTHNNCGGSCVRAGQRQWLHHLRTFPERYAEAERGEQQLRLQLGDVAILKIRRSGKTIPLPLTELRRRAHVERTQTGRGRACDHR
ncbi:hypothetical protein GCM10022226_61590 [Sphaerisporangium flaviroseum]|uniref:Phosphoadenosine phosphosulphate reductase domain-containing protein n=1 Tax=Sphaerisporangium flaviroseum TaxID=509199 RepID=A0ABP7J247_9ACTN